MVIFNSYVTLVYQRVYSMDFSHISYRMATPSFSSASASVRPWALVGQAEVDHDGFGMTDVQIASFLARGAIRG